MALDPNWFYSSLAQSTAAIVGLGGGFLVQRLLQQRNEIAEPRARLRSDLLRSYKDFSSLRQQALNVRDTMKAAVDEANGYGRDQFQAFEIRGVIHAFHDRLGTSGLSGIAGTIEFSELPRKPGGSRARSQRRYPPTTGSTSTRSLEGGETSPPTLRGSMSRQRPRGPRTP
jgi:hypothetical protein